MSSGVDFRTCLFAALMHTDPKSIKSCLIWLSFLHFWNLCTKAARKMLMKFTPGRSYVSLQFRCFTVSLHNNVFVKQTCSVYRRRKTEKKAKEKKKNRRKINRRSPKKSCSAIKLRKMYAANGKKRFRPFCNWNVRRQFSLIVFDIFTSPPIKSCTGKPGTVSSTTWKGQVRVIEGSISPILECQVIKRLVHGIRH